MTPNECLFSAFSCLDHSGGDLVVVRLWKFHEEIIVSAHHQEPFLSVTTTEDFSLVHALFAFIWTTCCPLRKNEGLHVV